MDILILIAVLLIVATIVVGIRNICRYLFGPNSLKIFMGVIVGLWIIGHDALQYVQSSNDGSDALYQSGDRAMQESPDPCSGDRP